MASDNAATLIVATDLNSKNKRFPIASFKADDALVFNWLIQDSHLNERFLSLRKIMSKLSQESLVDQLQCVLTSLAEEFSTWLEIDFLTVQRSKRSSCKCSFNMQGFEKVYRGIFKACKSLGECTIQYYCLNSLNHVYVRKDFTGFCNICQQSFLTRVSSEERVHLHPSEY